MVYDRFFCLKNIHYVKYCTYVKKQHKYLFTATYCKRKVRARLMTNAHTHTHTYSCHYAIGQILIIKFLSKKGFEPSCANYDPVVLMN